MSKQEVYAKIFKALLEAELLNEEGVDDLQRNVEEVIGKNAGRLYVGVYDRDYH